MTQEKARILLLEDDADWVDTLMGYLGEYEVYPATSLRKAHKLLDQQTFHLAIVDISLVLGDARDAEGFRLIEELRNSEILPDMNIIIATAYPSAERIRKAFKDYQVHDFIDKMTLNPQEFKQEVAEAITESYARHLWL